MVQPRTRGGQPKNHYQALASMDTRYDALTAVESFTNTALLHCVASSTHKTYQSAWNSWTRVAEIFQFDIYCTDVYTGTALPSTQLQQRIIQYISWECGVCRLSPRSIRKTYLPGIAKRLARSLIVAQFRDATKTEIIRCVLDGYSKIWARQHPSSDSIKVPFTTALAQQALELLRQGTISVHGKYVNNDSLLCQMVRCRTHAALMFGIFFLLRKTEYLATQDPPPLSTGGRILRRRMLAFYDTDNVEIHYAKIGQAKANSIRLVLQFSKTDPTGQGRIVIHCRQPDSSGNCIVKIMETWIAVTRDLYFITESDPVWQIPGLPILNGDTISDVMKSTCDELGLPRNKVSTHSLRYGGATELAASGLPQYIIAAYGGWTEDSRAMRIYTRLSLPTNAMVSQRMAQAASSRSAQTVVNDILMHRIDPQDRHPASDSSASSSEEPRKRNLPNNGRKGRQLPQKRKGDTSMFADQGRPDPIMKI